MYNKQELTQLKKECEGFEIGNTLVITFLNKDYIECQVVSSDKNFLSVVKINGSNSGMYTLIPFASIREIKFTKNRIESNEL